MTTFRGERVTLRPVRPEEFDVLFAQRRRHVDDWGVNVDEGWLRERVAHSGEFHHSELLLAVEAEGRLVGEIQARQPEHGLPPGVFELGIEIYDEADRRKGYGTEATALLVSDLFLERAAHRVQAGTELGNGAMRGVLERLGFTFEGTMRGYMPAHDPQDYALYGITRGDWESTRGAWISRS